MSSEIAESDGRFDDAVAEIARLQHFEGTPQEFWPGLMGALSGVIGADYGVLVTRDKADKWSSRLVWPRESAGKVEFREFTQQLAGLAKAAVAEGSLCQELPGGHALATQFSTGAQSTDVSLGIFLLRGLETEAALERLARLRLAANVPAAYAAAMIARRASSETEPFSRTLELMTLLHGEKRFLAAALTCCNEITTNFGCTRVSIGILEKNYVRLKAMSNTEKFEKRMEVVQLLERSMEECLDQDEEIVFPGSELRGSVVRDHEAFVRRQGGTAICSLPMRVENDCVGVLVCERDRDFSERDVRNLRLVTDQVSGRLHELHGLDRWFGARLSAWTRDKLSIIFGVEHTWSKLLAVGAVAALIFLAVGKMDYRVEGNFELRSRTVSFVAAPYDGFIRGVAVDVDDEVKRGQALLQLDTAELTLQQSAAAADANRYRREVDKARAEGELAAMNVSSAKLEQSESQLKLLSHRLGLASVKSPIDGVIVEGELKERLGSPVEKGEGLFRIAQLSDFYVELEVPQSEIHELEIDMLGEVAFASQPELKFPVRVMRIEPVARSGEGGSVFVVHAEPAGDLQDWWRPGMSGVGKLEAGKRSIIWVFTHETIDFLRMFFWL